jgi:2,3,4,5-tetrahydropyridine-2-carboxylate N-succinyltransferase
LSNNLSLRNTIEESFSRTADRLDRKKLLGVIRQLKTLLNDGAVRAAECIDGEWRVNEWVKKGILLAFRVGRLKRWPENSGFPFLDKETMAVRKFTVKDGVRVVPGGSAIRDGSFVAPGVVMMPPSYVNIGAYVDSQTMIDSHALVGSCAQIGKRVHLSAAAQIGGVLEPIGSMPVIIEDDVFIGGNCGIYEGTIVKRGAVVAAGVILTGSTPVYDLVHQKIYRRQSNHPLVIPENAVVVAGNRHVDRPFAKEHHLSIYTPVILKYRDERTDAATVLEESLR